MTCRVAEAYSIALEWQLRTIDASPHGEHGFELVYDHSGALGVWNACCLSRFDGTRKHGLAYSDDPVEAVREAIAEYATSRRRTKPGGLLPFDAQMGDAR